MASLPLILGVGAAQGTFVMTRRAWWLTAAIAVVALPAAAIGVAISLVTPEALKAPLIDAVFEATGRTLTLNGPLRVSWSLWPTLQVNDVRLANVTGGSRPDMARAEQIEARISLLPLLNHRLDILQLTLTGPNILFESVDGRSNWIFQGKQDSGDAPPPSTSTPFQLSVRKARVVNGMVTSRLPARTRVVGLRSLDVQHNEDGGSLDLAGTFVYGDNKPFFLQASAVPTDGVHGPWATKLIFAAFDTTATGAGTMTLAGEYDLQVDARSGAVDKLNALLPDLQLPAVRGAELSAHVVNGPILGSLPTVGPAKLTFENADFRRIAPGLTMSRVQASLPAAGGQASVSGQGAYAGVAFNVHGAVGTPKHPDGPATLPVDLTWTTGANTLSMKGNLSVSKLRFAGLKSNVAVSIPALAALRATGWPDLPPWKDVRFDGGVTVPADTGSVQLQHARLTSSAGNLSGDATLGGRKMLAARLNSDRLDADAVLAAFGLAGPIVKQGNGSARMIPDTALPWVATGAPTIDVALSIDLAIFAGQAWNNLALVVQNEGRKRAATAEIALPSGPLKVSLEADADGGAVPVSLSIHAPALPLALVAAHAGVAGPVSGSARIDADLRGAGTTLRQLAASLEGPFSLVSVNGEVSNQSFLKLTGGALQALGITIPASGATTLRCLDLVGVFRKGMFTLQTLALASTYLSLTGAGQVDFANENVQVKIFPLAQVGGSPVAVPVIIEGPFSNIGGHLDATGLDKLGLLIDGLFGGDKPISCGAAGAALATGEPRH